MQTTHTWPADAMSDPHHVVMFSGGACSWLTARAVADRYGSERITLLFADTMMEDPSLYAFLDAAALDIGAKLIKTAEGRTPWEVFFDVRFLGNTRADPCSRILKREHLAKWLVDNCDPAATVVYLGFSYDEADRFTRAQKRWAETPWTIDSPLVDGGPMSHEAVMRAMKDAGLPEQRLYTLGFPHNNCGGFCIKAGQSHFALLLETLPDVYARHERQEQRFRAMLEAIDEEREARGGRRIATNVAILRDRRGGTTKPLTLRELRERIEAGQEAQGNDWGGCGCFSPGEQIELFQTGATP